MRGSLLRNAFSIQHCLVTLEEVYLGECGAVGGQVAVQGGPSFTSQDDEVPVSTIQALAGRVDVQGASMSSKDS